MPRLILATAAALACHPASAYWSVVPQADIGLVTESNPRYLVNDGRSATGVYSDLRAELISDSPNARFSLRPRVRSTNYLEDNSDINDDDRYLDTSYAYRGLRGQVGIAAGYSDVAIRTGEFESATPEDPDANPVPGGGSGRFREDETQETLTVRPFLSYNLSPRNTLRLSVDYTDRDYDENTSTGYVDYTYTSAELSLVQALNAKNALFVSLTAGGFEADLESAEFFRNRSDNYGLNVGYQRALTPAWAADLTLGTTRSNIEIRNPFSLNPDTGASCAPVECRTTEQNFVGGLTLRRRGQLTNVNFDALRSIAPRSDGSEVVQDQLRVFVERKVTARLFTSIAFVYLDENAVADLFRQEREYFNIEPRLRWQLTPNWSLVGTYSFSQSENKVTTLADTDQDNNRWLVGFSWRGAPIRW